MTMRKLLMMTEAMAKDLVLKGLWIQQCQRQWLWELMMVKEHNH